MTIFKKLIMALFVSTLMLATTQPVMAAEGAPSQTLTDVIKLNEETIAAMESGADYNVVAALLKETKQASKSVVISGPADLNKQKGSTAIKKARKAYRAGDFEKAIKMAKKGLGYYKKAKSIHFN